LVRIVDEMTTGMGEKKCLGKYCLIVASCIKKIPVEILCSWTQAFVVNSRRTTAWNVLEAIRYFI